MAFDLTISALYLSSLIEIIEDMGWPRDAQLRELGKSAVEMADPRLHVPFDAAMDHFRLAQKTLDCPDLGVQIGHKFRVATFVETGSILNFCNSLAHACEINRRYEPLVETAGQSSLVREGECAYLQWNPRFRDDDAHRAMTEIIFAGYVATVQWLSWGFNKGVKSVAFRHAKPAYSEVYEALFQCPISFGAAHNRLQFFSDTVDQPLPTRDAAKLDKMCKKLDRLMAKLAGDTEMGRQVRRTITASIGERPVTLSNIAAQMGMSDRTLRRKLNAEGLTFRGLVDETRKAMFDTLLARGESLTTIALMLGYNDQSAFIRAFRRWYGISPSAYRTQMIAI